ncbi:DUF1697 domain-containing protein [Oscillospiraceae bacterium CM]|nr:DUF1697 domain-containing protein [Oscillospiraceae bacterium CM]
MAEKYCIFLRGVNTGGKKMIMSDLKKAFTDLGFYDAQTILATGNVVLSADAHQAASLKALSEKTLGTFFMNAGTVFVRSEKALQAVLNASTSIAVPEHCHIYWLFCDDSETVSELIGLFSTLPHEPGEAFVPAEDGAFWVVPIGKTLDSAFGSKALGHKKYKDKLTSRNMNTIIKILSAMDKG